MNLFYQILYSIIYFFFHNFSGAGNKPQSDKYYDNKNQIKRENCKLYKITRWFERLSWSNQLFKYPTKTSLDLPIVYIDQITPEVFNLLTNNKTKPIVIRGLIKDTTAFNKWNPTYFQENYGDIEVITLDNKKTGMRAYTSFAIPLGQNKNNLYDIIEDMKNPKDTKCTYINNVTSIFNDCPKLLEDLELDKLKYIDEKININTVLKVNLFMGPVTTGSSLHCAVGGNFFFNIYGHKRWILIDPKYTPYLSSTPAHNFSFVISGEDVENPSELLQKIPKYEIILEPGDVLFNPPWWWHAVHNEDFTIACAIRDHTCYLQSLYNNPVFMLNSPYWWKLNPWFLKIIKYIKGHDWLLQKSLKSDQGVADAMSIKKFE